MNRNNKIYSEEGKIKNIFNNNEKKSKLPKWIEEFLPQFTTEIPRDPLDKDDDNLLPIKNDKQMPILQQKN